MRSIVKIKTGLISLSFMLFSVLIPLAMAIPVNNTDTVIVSNLSTGTAIEFIFNNGLPVFAKADSQGEARYLALSDGDVQVIAMKDGNIINSSNYTVSIEHLIPSKSNVTGGGGTGGGGGGSGTGCGGVIDSEPLVNIVGSQMVDGSIRVNSSTRYSFNSSTLSIYELIVTNNVDIDCLSIKVERLKEPSKTVSSPAPGNIYANENIVSDKTLSSVTVRFKVENSWLNSQGIDKRDIVLYKYSSGSWDALETDLKTDDDIYTYYEANDAGFTSFAIGSKGTSVTPVPTIPVSTETTPTATTTETRTIPTAIPTQKTPGFESLIAIFIVSLLYIGNKLKKKR